MHQNICSNETPQDREVLGYPMIFARKRLHCWSCLKTLGMPKNREKQIDKRYDYTMCMET